MAKETTYIIIRESVRESLITDAGTLGLFIGLISVGVFLDSSALQWVGALVGFIIVISRAIGKQKYMTKEEAIQYLKEMK